MAIRDPKKIVPLDTFRSKLDPASPTPLYHQIFVLLRDRIYRGEYQSGAFLPGEQDLAEFFDVSRITAKRALDELAAGGLAIRERGRGTRVFIRPQGVAVRGNVDGLVHSLYAKGDSRVRLLEFKYIPAPADIAGKLGLAPGDEVQWATRIWYSKTGPFNHLSTYVPSKVGHHWTREDLESRPLVSLLQKSGIRISRAEDSITAILADETIAPLLEVEPASALLKVTRTVFGENGQAVEHVIALYPPDRYHYAVLLDQPAGQGAGEETGSSGSTSS